MPSLKSFRIRMRSVKSTQQITKAMKMVAAAKLRRAQEATFAGRDYSHNMSRIVQNVAAAVPEDSDNYPLLSGRQTEVRRVELIVFSADRGLCGSFNSSIIRGVRTRVTELEKQGFQVSLNFVGRKAHDVLKRQFASHVRKHRNGFGRAISQGMIQELMVDDLLRAYNSHEFDVCYLVYNTFRSAMSQTFTVQQVIPVPPAEEQNDQKGIPASPLFEPSEEVFIEEIMPHFLSSQIYQAVLESEASEHGARMTAMDSAVKNASEMIRKLTIQYNRTRQANITRELMEIIGGAEALKG